MRLLSQNPDYTHNPFSQDTIAAQELRRARIHARQFCQPRPWLRMRTRSACWSRHFFEDHGLPVAR